MKQHEDKTKPSRWNILMEDISSFPAPYLDASARHIFGSIYSRHYVEMSEESSLDEEIKQAQHQFEIEETNREAQKKRDKMDK